MLKDMIIDDIGHRDDQMARFSFGIEGGSIRERDDAMLILSSCSFVGSGLWLQPPTMQIISDRIG